MASTKNQVFNPLPLSTWTGPPPPCGRPRAVDMKNTHRSLEVASTCTLYNDLPDLKLKFDYMILIYLNCTVIYITNIFCRKISTFSVERQNSGKKDAHFFEWEEDSMTSVDSNFNFLCGRRHGAGPSLPRPHASTWAWPLPPPCGRHKCMVPNVIKPQLNALIFIGLCVMSHVIFTCPSTNTNCFTLLDLPLL